MTSKDWAGKPPKSDESEDKQDLWKRQKEEFLSSKKRKKDELNKG